ncbi:MAG: response regulator [Alteromonadaceae bacterium]|nr:response regulator [Alteromonadaceae bacterium]
MLNTSIDTSFDSTCTSVLTTPLTDEERRQLASLFAVMTDHLGLSGAFIVCHNRSLWHLLYETVDGHIDATLVESLLQEFRASTQWSCQTSLLDFALNKNSVLAALTTQSAALNIDISLCVIRDGTNEFTDQTFTQLQHYLVTIKNLVEHTAERRALTAPFSTKQRLRFILEATRAGTWEWEINTGKTHFNEQWASIVGYTLEELQPVSIDTWNNLVHPEDKSRSAELLGECFSGKREYYDCECRMRHKKGHWVWVHDRGKVIEWGSNNEPLYMAGTHTDITDKKHIELALAEKANFQKTVFDNLPVYLFVKDTEYRIIDANKAFLSLYPEAQRNAIIGTTTIEDYNQEEAKAFLKYDILAFAKGYSENEEQIQFPNGELRTLWTTKTRFTNNRGESFILIVATDITDINNSREALKIAKNEAEAANRAKSEFLATMSHEIRTPINGIMGMIELAAETTSDQELLRRLELANSSARALMAIVNDVLDFSKIEAKKIELEQATFNIDTLVNRIIYEQQSVLDNKPLELIVNLSQLPFTEVVGDEVRIGQIISNLLSNAIKFTPRGHVALSLRGLPKGSEAFMLEISVTDTGIGITEEQQQALFSPFTQADSSTTRNYGGTGLGLSICQSLCTLMKGTITFESEPQAGSTFTATVMLNKPDAVEPPPVTGGVIIIAPHNRQTEQLCAQLTAWKIRYVLLPTPATLTELYSKKPPALDWLILDQACYSLYTQWLQTQQYLDLAAQLPANYLVFAEGAFSQNANGKGLPIACAVLHKPLLRGELHELLASAQGKRVPEQQTASPQVNSSSVGRILIVEDNEINQEVAKEVLSNAGYNALVADNGQKALNALKNNSDITLVLMDCRMPVMDGFAATAAIRNGDAGKHYTNVPIIACTANASVQDKQGCLDAGMNAYLSKPLDQKTLLDTINNLLSK